MLFQIGTEDHLYLLYNFLAPKFAKSFSRQKCNNFKNKKHQILRNNMFYVNAKYLARRMKIEEFVVQQTTNWTFLKKKCQACLNGKFKPYRNPNDDPLCITRHSNHPPSIIKQLPTSINKCILALLADEQTFHGSASIYPGVHIQQIFGGGVPMFWDRLL